MLSSCPAPAVRAMGGDGSCRAQLLGCRQGRTASSYPAACCPAGPARRSMRRYRPNRNRRIASLRYLPSRELRLGTSDTAIGQATCSRWLLVRRCRSSKAALSVARPHSHVRTTATPFPGPRPSVPGSACDAPCARGWHAIPRVACRRASQGSPPGRPRPLVTIGTNAGISRTRPPRGRGSYAVLWRAPSRRAARCWCPGADVLCRSPARGTLPVRAGTPVPAGIPG
jgi:hypothetical protein